RSSTDRAAPEGHSSAAPVGRATAAALRAGPAMLHQQERACSDPAASSMNILLLGSGGREHALAWKIAASPLTERLVCAPGNAGIARERPVAPLDLSDHAAVVAFCRANRIDLVVAGPEAPLCAGIGDDLN